MFLKPRDWMSSPSECVYIEKSTGKRAELWEMPALEVRKKRIYQWWLWRSNQCTVRETREWRCPNSESGLGNVSIMKDASNMTSAIERPGRMRKLRSAHWTLDQNAIWSCEIKAWMEWVPLSGSRVGSQWGQTSLAKNFASAVHWIRREDRDLLCRWN